MDVFFFKIEWDGMGWDGYNYDGFNRYFGVVD